MRLLLDTHALLWWAHDAPQLSASARTAILTEANEVFVSPISFYELGLKVRRGLLNHDLGDLAGAARADGFATLAITIPHAHNAAVMEWEHRDPWDRLLAAQARLEACALVSVDQAFDTAGVERIW